MTIFRVRQLLTGAAMLLPILWLAAPVPGCAEENEPTLEELKAQRKQEQEAEKDKAVQTAAQEKARMEAKRQAEQAVRQRDADHAAETARLKAEAEAARKQAAEAKARAEAEAKARAAMEARMRTTEEKKAGAPVARIEYPGNGGYVARVEAVRGTLRNLSVSQSVFLIVRSTAEQFQRLFYPQGQLMPDIPDWTIRAVFATPNYNYQIFVVATANPASAELLREPRSRSQGLKNLPEDTRVISEVITVTRLPTDVKTRTETEIHAGEESPSRWKQPLPTEAEPQPHEISPATKDEASGWKADWQHDINATALKVQCPMNEFAAQGYRYAFFVDVPVARLKNSAEAWSQSNGRAVTVMGCWFVKDDGLAHGKLRRKKDGKTWEQDFNFGDGSWWTIQ
jgi:hypothetical protein